MKRVPNLIRSNDRGPSTVIHIRLSQKLVDRADKLADMTNRTRAGYFTHALWECIHEDEKQLADHANGRLVESKHKRGVFTEYPSLATRSSKGTE
jgi:predicted transcriptional regulator